MGKHKDRGYGEHAQRRNAHAVAARARKAGAHDSQKAARFRASFDLLQAKQAVIEAAKAWLRQNPREALGRAAWKSEDLASAVEALQEAAT